MKEIQKQLSEGANLTAKTTLPPPTQGRGGNHFPNTIVYSHTGEKFRLYDDLIRDKIVTVNFMSIKGHKHFAVTEHLARIADLLGVRLGRSVFMLSITTDPRHDTPERLRTLANKYGAKQGWHFLTTSKDRVEAISGRLYKHKHVGHYGHPSRLVHYGNGSLGLWGAFPADSDPDFAVQRLSWIEFGKQPTGRIRRAGPRRLGNDFTSHNRE